MPGPTLSPKVHPTKIRPEVRYYQWQLDGVRWMQQRQSFLLADEQGLGKTLQTLSCAAIDWDKGRAKRALVICEAKLRRNWQREISLFTTFDAVLLEGKRDEQEKILSTFSGDILIAGYEGVRDHLDEISGLEFDIVFVDECHNIKNPKTKRTKAVHKLEPKRWFLISGTPMENRPDEIWSPLKLMIPDTMDYWPWIHRFCYFGGYGGKQIVGVKKKDELKKYLSDVVLRRLKKDVAHELPDKQYIKILVDLTPYQQKHYDRIEEELRVDMAADPDPVEMAKNLQKALRLRQICSTPANLDDPDHPGQKLKDESAKLDVAVDQLRELMANGHKVVVFTQWRATLTAIEERCKAAGLKHWTVRDSMSPKKRFQAQLDWTDSPEPAAFLATYGVAGVGLTLTAAGHMIVVDKLYNPGKMAQAEDRIHRIGASTTQPVQIIELVAAGTYEERVDKVLNDKGRMIDTLMPNSGWQKKLYDAIRNA